MIQREADDNNMHNKDLQTRSFGGIASVSQSVAQMKAHAKGRRSLVRRCGGDSHRQVGLCLVVCWSLNAQCTLLWHVSGDLLGFATALLLRLCVCTQKSKEEGP